VVGASKDECVSVYNTESKLAIKCSPGHEGSALFAQIDASGQFLASSGTDGNVNIYKLSDDKATLLKKVKISKKVSSTARMELSWLESESILVSGNTTMGIIMQGDSEKDWSLDYQEAIFHAKDITSIMKINDEVMVTHSCEDHVTKIWCINEEGCECLHELKTKNAAMAMEYDNHSKCLAFMDTECNLGLFKRDFSKKEED
jgi:WD40 repeat protein